MCLLDKRKRTSRNPYKPKNNLIRSAALKIVFLCYTPIITKEIIPFRRQLTQLFTKYLIDLSNQGNFWRRIEQQFLKSFSLPIPPALEERAHYEKQLILSIQYQLKHNRLILRRTTDEYKTYYLGQLDEFNSKANEYMKNSNCYEMIGTINENNSEQQHLNRIIESIDSILYELEQKRLIKKDHLTKF